MKRIYKYTLGRDGDVVHYTGKFERFLDVRTQNGIPTVWIELNDDVPEISIDIVAIGTGRNRNGERLKNEMTVKLN